MASTWKNSKNLWVPYPGCGMSVYKSVQGTGGRDVSPPHICFLLHSLLCTSVLLSTKTLHYISYPLAVLLFFCCCFLGGLPLKRVITLDSLNGFFCFVLFCGNETFNSIQVFHIARSFLLKVNSVEKKNYKKNILALAQESLCHAAITLTRGGEKYFFTFFSCG